MLLIELSLQLSVLGRRDRSRLGQPGSRSAYPVSVGEIAIEQLIIAEIRCIVHLLRHSLRFVSFKDRKQVAKALRTIYQAPTTDAAEEGLAKFESEWDRKYPAISRSWRRNWEQVIPFFDFPPDIRRVIYTTNAIESLHSSVRKVIKNRGHFPNDEAATKLIYLALRNIEKKWKMPATTWKEALNQFAVLFEERLNAGR